MAQEIAALAASFNLEKGLISNLQKSQPTRKIFLDVVKASKLQSGQKKIGNMLYSIATKLPVTIEKHRIQLSAFVGNNDINNPNQLDFCIEYLKNKEQIGGVDMISFKKDCGIGIVLSEEDVKVITLKIIEKADQNSKKFQFMAKVKEEIPYVEGKLLRDVFEATWKAKGLPDKVVEKKVQKVKDKAKEEEQAFHIKDIGELIGREMKSLVNSKEILKERTDKFGDIVLTRFPPEPNGYLHIGHCKAMRFNFMQAKVNKGGCYLRFDDTNPTKENLQFIENIKENISFMGYNPWKITHASDNFDKLYEFAVQLIKQGDAFVCAEGVEEVRKKRGEGLPSKFRDRPVAENLKLFNEMKLGLHAEGSCSLRAKIDCKHPNTTLRDPVIYRIKFANHPHVGDKWCIYPLYDYTHPLCDSLQGITHSLCSLQFEIRRQLYYWTLQKLNLYRPNVWQYSRLNITYTVLSKRKLHEMIFTNKVNGWDDPRILTINGMRRRGYPSEAINNFIDAVGVTRRGNQNYLKFSLLQHEVRKHFDVHSPRTMAVLDPVEMVINGLQCLQIQVPLFPKDEKKGFRKIRFTKRIYIERSDIKLQDEKGFYGIAPNKVVGLKYASTIIIKEIISEGGVVKQVIAQLDIKKSKPLSYLNWISVDDCFDCEVRNYGLLFTIEKPADHDDYLKFLNQKSLQVLKNAKVHKDVLANIKMTDNYQFQRKGFYCLDRDTNLGENKLVWNETVGLVDRKK